MKRIVFLASFVVITATDAILGFKTANSFGITEKPFALVFALGFALMSVPLKIIYERAVEVNYSKQYGGYIFGIFSIIWLLAFGLSLKGLGEYRVNNLVGKELENMNKLAVSENYQVPDTTKKSYRIARAEILQKAKTDSIRIMADLQLREKLLQSSVANSSQKDSSGFVFFSLLLVLSGAVCLHFGLEKQENLQVLQDFSKDDKKETLQDVVEVVKQANNNLTLKIDLAEQLYHCNDCQRGFSRHGYNGHFKHSKTCNKGNYTLQQKENL